MLANMSGRFWLFCAIATIIAFTSAAENQKPNIVIILIDDMGFNDVSFHGSNNIITPNMDALAYNGIILNKFYTPNLCTPSRSALLTGKYPSHTGTQHSVIFNDEPWGLPLTEKLMPEFFRAANYSTHLVGKWHLGHWLKEFTPTYRGFDDFVGYYSGMIDYYDHTVHMANRNYSRGLDLRRNLTAWPEADGLYATDIFTAEAERIIKEHDTKKPLYLQVTHLAVHTGDDDKLMQAPEEEIEKYSYLSNPQRQIYGAMISKLDESVGKTVKALSDKGILNNTILLLLSDNGGPTAGNSSNTGSNYPFRGQKVTSFEGGVRNVGAIWSPLLKQQRYVSNQIVHIVDLLPTLASAAGVPLPNDLKIDGINVWKILSENLRPNRRNVLLHLNDVAGYSSFINGQWKFINNTIGGGAYDTWAGDLPKNETDPLAVNYEQNILSSIVHKALNPNEGILKRALRYLQFKLLRSQARVKCAVRGTVDESFSCNPLLGPCVFDIENDPCEQLNLAKMKPELVKKLSAQLQNYLKSVVPSAQRSVPDPRADPRLHNGNWEWWGP